VRGTILINVENCMKCKRCVIACAVEHSESKTLLAALEEADNGKEVKPRISIGVFGGIGIPIQCRHCENAQCAAVCPTGAIERLGKAGPVVIHPELCIGCRSCQVVCHFGVPQLTTTGQVFKCDMCIERLNEDRVPACVEACPTYTLRFVPYEEELEKKASKSVLDRLRT